MILSPGPYVFSEEAKIDLTEIWSFIAEDNERAADQLEAEIYKACERLAKRPDIGHSRKDLTDKPALFFLVQTNYLIIYDPSSKPLEILRVLHGARDVGEEF